MKIRYSKSVNVLVEKISSLIKMVINSVNLPLEICSISGGGDVNANYGGVDTEGTQEPAIKQLFWYGCITSVVLVQLRRLVRHLLICNKNLFHLFPYSSD